MCGIAYVYTAKGRASKLAFQRYIQQKKRGSEGYGAVCVSHRIVNKVYRSEQEEGIKSILGNKSDMILFHHRRPTSTPNFEECTHPIFVSNELLEYDYYVTHNGVISNALELKTRFNKLGFNYLTEVEEVYKTRNNKTYTTKIIKFNDSESLAIDLAIAIEEGKKSLDSKGTIAFVAMQVNKESKVVENIFYGRNLNSPLVVQKKDGNIIIASEGEGDIVAMHTLFCFDTSTKIITSTKLDVGTNYSVPSPIEYTRNHSDTDRTKVLFDSSYHDEGRHHHATHDILKHHRARHFKHLTKKELKRLRFHVEERIINVADKHGKIEEIKYIVKGQHLLYTTIYQDDIERSMLSYHWFWYLRVIKNKSDFEYQIKKHKGNIQFEYQKRLLVNQLKNCAKEFEIISEAVNKIAANDIKNRKLLDEAADIQSEWEREAQEEVRGREAHHRKSM